MRQLGAMIEIEFVKNKDPRQPNTELTQSIVAKAAKHGIILLACGFYGNVIRFLPPLTVELELENEGLDRFEDILSEILDQ